MAEQSAQTSQQRMSLSEALAASKPLPPLAKTAYKSLEGNGTLSVTFDGTFWDVLYRGSPFGFDTQLDVEGFLEEEGITLQGGWMPETQR